MYGSDGLHPRRTAARPGRPPQLGLVKEWMIIATAILLSDLAQRAIQHFFAKTV